MRLLPEAVAAAARQAMATASVVGLCFLCSACSGDGGRATSPPPVKRFAVPLFDGLWLGMTRDEAARAHPLRPALTSAGKNRLVWIYERPGEYGGELTFESSRPDARLERIDIHFGGARDASRRTIDALAKTLGQPDATHRQATTNAYCDRAHDQFDTIYSDATQYVFVTECVAAGDRRGPPTYYLSVKKKELAPTGPPTGYVPPPPPKGKDGKPVEEPVF
jgi:hypothetical protein